MQYPKTPNGATIGHGHIKKKKKRPYVWSALANLPNDNMKGLTMDYMLLETSEGDYRELTKAISTILLECTTTKDGVTVQK